ncbi:MAG: hypothetical protein H0W42_00170 [Gemmatimonadaceae bacterium]|nr:hypothetical protein [Gemmatimonadaceae bacterium]
MRGTMQRLRQEGLLLVVGGASGLRGRDAVAPVQRDRTLEIYAMAGAIEGARALSIRSTFTPCAG